MANRLSEFVESKGLKEGFHLIVDPFGALRWFLIRETKARIDDDSVKGFLSGFIVFLVTLSHPSGMGFLKVYLVILGIDSRAISRVRGRGERLLSHGQGHGFRLNLQ